VHIPAHTYIDAYQCPGALEATGRVLVAGGLCSFTRRGAWRKLVGEARRAMDIEWRVTVGDEVRRAICALVEAQRTLEDVVRWGLALAPPRIVEDVVVQDEYTHDVVMAHPAGVYLVYDTT